MWLQVAIGIVVAILIIPFIPIVLSLIGFILGALIVCAAFYGIYWLTFKDGGYFDLEIINVALVGILIYAGYLLLSLLIDFLSKQPKQESWDNEEGFVSLLDFLFYIKTQLTPTFSDSAFIEKNKKITELREKQKTLKAERVQAKNDNLERTKEFAERYRAKMFTETKIRISSELSVFIDKNMVQIDNSGEHTSCIYFSNSEELAKELHGKLIAQISASTKPISPNKAEYILNFNGGRLFERVGIKYLKKAIKKGLSTGNADFLKNYF